MPLSFWGNQGLDVQRIESNTAKEDIEWNDQLGWCYRLRIRSQYKRRTFSQKEIFTLAQSKRRRPALQNGAAGASGNGAAASSGGGAAAPPPLVTDKDDSSNSSDSSSGSSSDSDEAPAPPPPAPETAQETKMRLAAAKAAAKAEAKAASAKAKAAAKVSNAIKKKADTLRSKVITALKNLRAAISSPLILDVPAAIIEPVRAQIGSLESTMLLTDEILAGVVEQWPAELDNPGLAEARRSEQLVLSVIKSIAKIKGIQL